ncbi:MAG: hypothetical protein J6W69_08565, partial [Bacteroidales bacterium]|nr:hypothetical protein [Bacteroidales bacterium]
FICKSKGLDDKGIVGTLATIYTETQVNEVLADMADRENVLRNFPLPMCFQCDKCRIRSCCSYLTVVKVEERIQQSQRNFIIDQKRIHQVFYNSIGQQ